MNALRTVIILLSVFWGQAHALPVAKNERALIAVINVNTKDKGFKLNAWYALEDIGARACIKTNAGSSYGYVRYLVGRNASLTNLARLIRSLDSNPSIKAIDLIVYIHGMPGQLKFINETKGKGEPYAKFLNMSEITERVKATGSQKLRAVYSDACYSASHVEGWLDAGFKIASGNVAVDSNQSRDLGKFLRNWTDNETFEYSIQRANTEGTYHTTDKWVKNGNSFKQWSGHGAVTIDQF
ncbi:MAG: hypothetical protein JST80_12030 [Bdellovibrionales bacterium]|nr:hypothetical protein [Bdellovibrionales bacterium]